MQALACHGAKGQARISRGSGAIAILLLLMAVIYLMVFFPSNA
jgi:hypothetical protein